MGYLAQLLAYRGHSFSTSAEMEVLWDIKEKQCYVSTDFQRDLHKPQHKTYKLPDGHSIPLGPELLCSAEALFRPSLVGSEEPGVHEMVFRTLSRVDVDDRKQGLGNIVLSGGTTCLPGFEERLRIEMLNLAPESCRVKICASERKYMVWMGGSILACLSPFQQMWLTKEEYDESGPAVVPRRRFW
eukprot:TRINITY_DN6290_c0_g1_i2.p3 TRINITY_DN6290_c0_g1~~TRINITY_DN6290_c0_g1_i2.p3  ORF type:complete len:186 (-),score=48.70 TRINITY_DN6290_c0_g1_i2:154-711(-)